MLRYGEMLGAAQPVAALGPHALAPAPMHSLLVACTHPVMHHRNDERLLWTYDVHLLASAATHGQLAEFLRLARERGVAGACGQSLSRSVSLFHTPLPSTLIDDLGASAASERSSVYLEPGRRWHDETASALRHLPSWVERIRFLRRILLPDRRYVVQAYGLSDHPLVTVLLPALYLHRNIRGALRILVGQK
jgi:hypothetical protein